ncbi:activating signal cointegrator 1 complex subunit 2 homolog isoform X1 [Aphis gossypii]|uniref:activating signal cointegrator 1 complex subunit 2 homolog isoform X1 n=1 Tax=Aphis gossypii TaxID=80765 RepID=UPI002158F21E|nr:activating signal cointegrator 1 complex subunit 2 homolog isoform X1 [Aphis gossypii]
MYSNGEHVAPTAVLILILCVLSTDQTLFSRKKSTTPATALDNVALQSEPVPQKETSHWWQRKNKPAKTNENPVPNQVAVAVPVPIHQKLQSIFETHFSSDVKWVPCLCPVRKGEHQQQHQQPQQQQQPQSQQPQPQQPQPQQRPQYQQPQKPQQYGPSTQAPSDNDVARFYFSNHPVEA